MDRNEWARRVQIVTSQVLEKYRSLGVALKKQEMWKLAYSFSVQEVGQEQATSFTKSVLGEISRRKNKSHTGVIPNVNTPMWAGLPRGDRD